MTAHPNRSRRKDAPGRNPDPREIVQTRQEAELTQTQAARLIYSTLRTWQDWEHGRRTMHPAMWQYWCLLISCRAVRQARLELFGDPSQGVPTL